jgi:Relaxase/Mobilisation nuclease domain
MKKVRVIVIANIKKHSGAAPLLNYLLKLVKKAQVIESSMFSDSITEAVMTERFVDSDEFRKELTKDLNESFDRVSTLNPRLVNNVMHLMIGFDPHDGEVSNRIKSRVAKDLLERMGFLDTYWAVIAHGRDDPEHGHEHNHDHIHIIASRINYNGRTISDSWDYPKTEKILRSLEREYGLQPFIPLFERDVIMPEIHWMIHLHEEEEQEQEIKQTVTRKTGR